MIKKKKTRLILTFLCICAWMVYFSFSLTGCVDPNEIYDAILPNFLIICVHTIATIILIIISIWLVWNPTKKMLSKRKSYIEKSLNEAEENKKDAIARLLEAEKKRLAAYEEAQLIIDRAKDEANFEGESILQLAKDDAKAIYANAKRGAKQLQQEIVKDNDRRVNELAINVCETIMHKKITKSDNDNIIRNIIKNVDKNGGKDE